MVTNSCLLANKFISLYIVREKVEQATLAVQVCASLLSSHKEKQRSLTYCTIILQANLE